jgi:hypothetical protein
MLVATDGHPPMIDSQTAHRYRDTGSTAQERRAFYVEEHDRSNLDAYKLGGQP